MEKMAKNPVTNFPIAIDKNVAAAVELLDESAREFFEERAAIMEYMGKIPREEAEKRALVETQKYVEARTKR